ncbi:MAG: glycosyltransferase family 39 protein [Patescibacteria group bacterium]
MKNILKLNGTKFMVLCIVVVVIAGLLRFWELGGVPAGLTWDEAAIGYNGHSVVTTYRDEWLVRLPISFKSFGDYKAPLAIYVSGIFSYFFGLDTWAIRLPFALSGVTFVAISMLLVWIVASGLKNRQTLTLLMGLLAALSPWHIVFSRVGFESGMAATLVAGAVTSFLVAVRQQKQWAYALSGTLFSLSMYAYHSAKITVPFLLLLLFWRYRQQLLKTWKKSAAFVVALSVISVPLAYSHIYGDAMTRAGVLIFSSQLSATEMGTRVFGNFIQYFLPGFLLFGDADSMRHSTGVFGVLSIGSYLLWLVGILTLVTTWFTKRISVASFAWLGLLILITGIVPAALVVETDPHPNRSLLALLGYLMLAIAGADFLLKKVSKWSAVYRYSTKVVFVSIVIGVELLFAFFFLKFYFTQYNELAGEEYLQGYREVFAITEQYRDYDSDTEVVDQIIFSTEYGQPYIFALLAKEASPYDFHAGVLRHYLFVDEITIHDFSRNNALLVVTNQEFESAEEPKHVVTDTAGQTRFRVYQTEKNTEDADE